MVTLMARRGQFMRARALCLLGYGFTAQAIARRMRRVGWRILASTRSQSAARYIADSGYEPVVADPAERAGLNVLKQAAAQANALISCAPPGEEGDPFAPVLDGLSRELWLGYLSTTGVYGDRAGGWAFEWQASTPGQPRSVRRVRAETQWSAHKARLFRLAGIYGPGRSAFDRLNRGVVTLEKPGHVFGRIHVDDIAEAVARALERPQAQGIFNLADDWPDTQANVMRGAAAIAGEAPPRIERFDATRTTPMQASFYAECRRVSNARAKAVLGWRPVYPSWREGLRAIWSNCKNPVNAASTSSNMGRHGVNHARTIEKPT